jgi:hypothetical protein
MIVQEKFRKVSVVGIELSARVTWVKKIKEN